ncbi:hypothetical protein ACF0H5_004932 [Mactra antiquata]
MKQEGKNIESYVESVLRLVKEIEKSDSQIFNQVVHWLDRETKRMVALKDISTIPELPNLARIMRDTADMEINYAETASSKTQYQDRRQQPSWRRNRNDT